MSSCDPVDWIQETVQRIHNPPSGWAWCRSEVIGESGHFLVTGGVPRTLTRGPRKGRRTWKGAALTQYVITKAQVDEGKSL
jgi:hypothetical protein